MGCMDIHRHTDFLFLLPKLGAFFVVVVYLFVWCFGGRGWKRISHSAQVVLEFKAILLLSLPSAKLYGVNYHALHITYSV